MLAKAGFCCAVFIALAGCNENKFLSLRQRLDGMPDAQAFPEFRKLSPSDQVGLFVWEFEHSKPPASRYGLVMNESGKSIVPLLLSNAMSTDDYLLNLTILDDLSAFPKQELSMLRPADIKAALRKCTSLSNSTPAGFCLRAQSRLEKNSWDRSVALTVAISAFLRRSYQ